MKLYIMRHGIALDVGEGGIRRDAERCLSAEGRLRTTEVAQGLAALGVTVNHILTSPLIRARETAEIVATVTGPARKPEPCDLLAPGEWDATRFVTWLHRSEHGSVMAVGHMPDVARMAMDFTCGSCEANIDFKKAGVCCIAFEHAPAIAGGILEWLLQPAHLRPLGRHAVE